MTTDTTTSPLQTPAVAPRSVRRRRSVAYYRDLVLELLLKEFKVRYKSTVLGYAWSVLHPLMFMLVFLFAFKIILRVQVENYALFLVAGLFPWQAFANSLCASTGVFISNSSLLKRVCFPRHFLVMVVVLNDMLHYLLSVPIIILTMLLYGVAPRWDMLWMLPVLLALQFLMTLGMSLVVATYNLFLRDLERLTTIITMLWFYVTPILYPESLIPQGLRWINYVNPMSSLIINWRHVFMAQGPDAWAMASLAGWTALSLAVGYGVYRRLNWRFGELV